ncbi:hypothetical protein [uncultured Fluviicola sp.]|uniref:hypothetical protein n=1 Tax=uncultured Fluviicola sp. TaxID=463303 RepID=UPI00260023A3|nr:hypothetical protein [uncultured Fluviicola sp.]
MQTQEKKTQQQKAAFTRDTGKQNNPGLSLTDNRPEALIQRKIQEAADNSPQAKNNSLVQAMAEQPVQGKVVTQLARTKREKKGTVSGHGGLRRNKKTGALIGYKVPKGKKIVITAPPGATLGDISLVLNTTDNPDYKKIRKMMKISTNKDLWKNSTVISIVRGNKQIGKTDLQAKLLKKLDTGKLTFNDLKGNEKGSLAALERSPEFEEWAESYVTPETFQVKNEGEEMDDMVLEPFEDELRSDDVDTANQNDYIEKKQMLSTYVKNNPDLTQITINACSADEHSDFTGFQIDKK